MRNYFAIAFTCVYLTLTVGVAKTTHYCMGRLNHSDLFTFETEKCRCAVYLQENPPCCKDTHELIVIDNDQSQGTVIAANAPTFFEIGSLYVENLLNPVSPSAERPNEFFSDNSPPPREALFKIYCSLVFYA